MKKLAIAILITTILASCSQPHKPSADISMIVTTQMGHVDTITVNAVDVYLHEGNLKRTYYDADREYPCYETVASGIYKFEIITPKYHGDIRK